jgi:uncharacterized protein involved in outer membrane biogenesis
MNFAWTWSTRVAAYKRTRGARKIGIAIVIALALYSLAGFLGVPALVRRVAIARAAAELKRPITIRTVSFNPFTLNLKILELSIRERGDPQEHFVDISRLRVEASWMSLFRLAPVINVLEFDRPSFHIIRTGPREFNFSDLLQSPVRTKPSDNTPVRFAVSNIRLRDGGIRFDDKVLGQQHSISHLQLGIPFIASLPSDANIYVQPTLQMTIDGSQLRIRRCPSSHR